MNDRPVQYLSVSKLFILAALIMFILAAFGVQYPWLTNAGLAAFAAGFLVP